MMRKKKTWFQRGSVLVKYIVSYLTVAVFGCTIIGFTLFTISTHELNQVAAESVEKRLQGVADDLSMQMTTMQNIAHEISGLPEYKRTYVTRHKYREVELLAELKKYQSYTPLSDQYFLVYGGEENIYIGMAQQTSWFSLFARGNLGCMGDEDTEEIRLLIEQSEKQNIIRCRNDSLLFVCPIRHDDADGYGPWLCFVVKDGTVEGRIRLIGGDFSGNVRLIWDGACVYGDADEMEAQSVCFEKNGIRVELVATECSMYSGLSTYTSIFWISSIVILLFTCLLAFFTANRNYRPIKELVNEFANDTKEAGNEFGSLQNLLRMMVENNRITQQRLKENLVWLDKQRRQNDEQMMLLALTGNLNTALDPSMEGYTLFEDGRSHTVICVSVKGKYDSGRLFAQIAQLGDRNMQFCGVQLPYEGMIAVTISSTDRPDLDLVVELLKGLLEAFDLQTEMGVGLVVDTAHRIPDSLASALADLNADAGRTEERSGEWFDEAMMNKMLTYIKEGQSELAHKTMDSILRQIERDNASVLIRSCAYSSVINNVIRIASKSGIDLSADQLSVVLLYNHPSKIKERLSSLLDELCTYYTTRRDERWESRKDDLFAYIREHFCEYGLCLSELGDVTGLSVRQIEQHVRSEYGMTFKEYLTTLRMEEAKHLLSQGMSVNDTSQAVCYMSVSFFIKTFKKITSMTPAEYRKMLK